MTKTEKILAPTGHDGVIYGQCRVRFHLGLGKHYMHWQVRHHGGVSYFDPDEYSLTLAPCRLRSQSGTARRIHCGANKSVCAWIDCKCVRIDRGVACTFGGVSVAYDPRVAPHWRDSLGNNIDGHRYRVIATAGRKLSGVRMTG
jgi:hypothetical protein